VDRYLKQPGLISQMSAICLKCACNLASCRQKRERHHDLTFWCRFALLLIRPAASSWHRLASFSWMSCGSTQYSSRSWLKLSVQQEFGTWTLTSF